MQVLVTGATGFIGRHLVAALLHRGDEPVLAVRRMPSIPAPRLRHVRADFTRDLNPEDWLPHLAGVNAVINTVGILREHGRQTFARLHTHAPQALFAACERAGVRRVIQISALGADAEAASAYHLSKRAADEDLAKRKLDWTVVQPALVYGPGGDSARLFTLLASLPLIPLPGSGEQRIQPIHVDDLVGAIVALLHMSDVRTRLPLAGPEPLDYREFLERLRGAMDLGAARFVPVPMPIMRAAASCGAWMPGALLDRDTLAMLERGNTASAQDTHALLGRTPRPVDAFIPASERRATRVQAQLDWLMPLLRYALALMWIVTGLVSLGLYPVEQSRALLARAGATGAFASLLLYGAAALDIAFGLGTVLIKRRRWLWLAQIGVILFYTVVITLRLPEFWLHPYGPVLKNLPILAGILLLQQLERIDGIHRR